MSTAHHTIDVPERDIPPALNHPAPEERRVIGRKRVTA